MRTQLPIGGCLIAATALIIWTGSGASPTARRDDIYWR